MCVQGRWAGEGFSRSSSRDLCPRVRSAAEVFKRTMSFRTFQLVSFGCKVNQVEGQALAERLEEMDLRREEDSRPGGPADLVVVNTCAVTAEAARRCRQRIRRAMRSGARVVVTGCYAHPAALDDSLRRIAGGARESGGRGVLFLEPDKRRVPARLHQTWPDLSLPVGDDAERADRFARSRAMLKVQDGCSASCAYCIVRKVRPQPRSTPPEAVLKRARALVAAGWREIVVCGIHLGLYGTDLEPRTSLAALVERLLPVLGPGRLRLSSIEPMEVGDDLLALMAAEPERICPHLHLPLQSGDDAVLARMRRPYTGGAFLRVVARAREALPQPAITSDLLVGFPGETPAAFENTLRVCREARLSRIHVFPFSPRPGTAAAEMDDRVPSDVIRVRRARAAEVGDALGREFREHLTGRTAQVVIERVGADGSAEVLSERYVHVRIRGPLPEKGGRRTMVSVNLCRVNGGFLDGVRTWAR